MDLRMKPCSVTVTFMSENLAATFALTFRRWIDQSDTSLEHGSWWDDGFDYAGLHDGLKSQCTK